MLAFHMGNGEIISSFDSIGESNNILIRNTVHLGNKYPEDVLLNAALIGNKLICNTKTILCFCVTNSSIPLGISVSGNDVSRCFLKPSVASLP